MDFQSWASFKFAVLILIKYEGDIPFGSLYTICIMICPHIYLSVNTHASLHTHNWSCLRILYGVLILSGRMSTKKPAIPVLQALSYYISTETESVLMLIWPTLHPRTIFHGCQIVLKVNLFRRCETALFSCQTLMRFSRMGLYLQTHSYLKKTYLS